MQIAHIAHMMQDYSLHIVNSGCLRIYTSTEVNWPLLISNVHIEHFKDLSRRLPLYFAVSVIPGIKYRSLFVTSHKYLKDIRKVAKQNKLSIDFELLSPMFTDYSSCKYWLSKNKPICGYVVITADFME